MKIDDHRNTRRIVVVGGGVVGCAVAFQLALDGVATTIVERDSLAAGASGRNAGNLNPLHGARPESLPQTTRAFEIHKDIHRELERLNCSSFGLSRAPRLHLAFTAAEQAALVEIEERHHEVPGFSAVWLEREALLRIERRLAPEVSVGLFAEGHMTVDGAAFTRALAEGAIKLGASKVFGAVNGLETHGGRATAVRTSSGRIVCDAVVLATGPWVGEYSSWLGIDVEIEPFKGEMLRVALPGGPPDYDLTAGATTFYRRGNGDVWIGVTIARSGYDETPTAAARHSLTESASRILPIVAEAQILDHVAALRPVARPDEPIARHADGWDNVFIANGGGSKGLLFSVAIARAIRDLVMERRDDVRGAN